MPLEPLERDLARVLLWGCGWQRNVGMDAQRPATVAPLSLPNLVGTKVAALLPGTVSTPACSRFVLHSAQMHPKLAQTVLLSAGCPPARPGGPDRFFRRLQSITFLSFTLDTPMSLLKKEKVKLLTQR